jgi:hypothetical protein
MSNDEEPKAPDTSGHAADAYSPPPRDPKAGRNKAMIGALVVLAVAVVIYLIALLLT